MPFKIIPDPTIDRKSMDTTDFVNRRFYPTRNDIQNIAATYKSKKLYIYGIHYIAKILISSSKKSNPCLLRCGWIAD